MTDEGSEYDGNDIDDARHDQYVAPAVYTRFSVSRDIHLGCNETVDVL